MWDPFVRIVASITIANSPEPARLVDQQLPKPLILSGLL